MSAIRWGSVLWSRLPFGPAAPCAALVEQHGMKPLGIEQAAVVRLAAAAGTSMQIDRGDTALSADAFDIDFMAVTDRKPLRGQRRKGIGTL